MQVDSSSHVSDMRLPCLRGGCLGVLALEQNGPDTSVFQMQMFASHTFLPLKDHCQLLLSALPVCLLPAALFLLLISYFHGLGNVRVNLSRIFCKRQGFK